MPWLDELDWCGTGVDVDMDVDVDVDKMRVGWRWKAGWRLTTCSKEDMM